MKDNKSGWQFPKALEIIKCKGMTIPPPVS